MNTNNYSVFAHSERFSTEQKCKDFLFDLKWKDGIECPHCGNKHMNYFIVKSNIYKCPKCRKHFSLIKGTIFEGTKLPLKVWFHAIYIFTTFKRGISSHQLAKQLGIQQRSAWFLLHRLREALKEENDQLLSGIVTVDETTIGPVLKLDRRLQVRKRLHDKKQNELYGLSQRQRTKLGIKKKQGRKKGTTKEVIAKRGKPYSDPPLKRQPFGHETHVFGMKEKEGKLQLKIIGTGLKDKTKEKIFPIMQNQIARTSIVQTDQASLYRNIDKYFKEHRSIVHGKTFVQDGIHTNDIENAWMQIKKCVKGTYFHVSKKYIQRYLDELSFRWNSIKQSQKQVFDSFLIKSFKTVGIKESQLKRYESIKPAA